MVLTNKKSNRRWREKGVRTRKMGNGDRYESDDVY